MKLPPLDSNFLNHANLKATVDPTNATVADLVPAALIPPKPVDWLWVGWLVAGKLNILGGQPGTGKTTIALYMAATISRGGIEGLCWPDKTFAPLGQVVIWSGEDGIEDTLIPRLIAAGADMSRVHILRGTLQNGRTRPFNFDTDLPILSEALIRIGNVRLVIIDSIVQAVSGDANKNAAVRRGLQPLGELAETHTCAVLGITHVNKGSRNKDPLERINGSLAFGAVPRVVLIAARGEQMSTDGTPPSSVLVRAKTTNADPDGGFEYRIMPMKFLHDGRLISASCIDWNPTPLQGSAKEILRSILDESSPSSDGATDAAARFLRDTLANGPILSSEVELLALAAQIAPSAVKRARKQLGVLSWRPMNSAGYVMSLPSIPATNASGQGIGPFPTWGVTSSPSVSPFHGDSIWTQPQQAFGLDVPLGRYEPPSPHEPDELPALHESHEPAELPEPPEPAAFETAVEVDDAILQWCIEQCKQRFLEYQRDVAKNGEEDLYLLLDKIDEITDDVVDSAFYDSSEEDTALNAPAYLRYLRNNPWWAS